MEHTGRLADEPQVEFTAIQGSSDTAKLLFFVGGKAVVMRTKRVSCHLPLAPIAPPSFDFVALQSLFQECEADVDTRYVADIFTQDTIADFLKMQTAETAHTVVREKIIAEAVDELCRQHTLTQVFQEPQGYAFNLPAFLIPKHDSISSRLIIDCRELNKRLTGFPLPKMPLPSVADIIQTSLKYKYMTTRDARCMFYQFPIPQSLADRLHIRVADRRGAFRVFKLNVLPMGLSLAPSMAQHVTNYLCRLTVHRLKQMDVAIFAWVDNFLVFSKTRLEGQQAVATLEEVCRQVGLELKIDDTPPTSVATALGLEFHLDLQYVAPTKDACEALQHTLDKLLLTPRLTPIQFFTWFGHANWINFSVANEPLCRYRALMNCARKMAAEATCNTWHTPLQESLDQETLQQAAHLTQTLKDSRRTATDTTIPPSILWTDACTRGL